LVYRITDPNTPSQVAVAQINPTCFGGADGSLMVTDILGGVGPFTFMINETVTDEQMIENLEAGTYNFTLIDANGCELDRVFELVAPIEIDADFEAPIEATYQDIIDLTSIYDDTIFDVDVINWYDSSGELIGTGDNVNFTILQNETIMMEVIDVNGCSIIKTRTIQLDEDYNYYRPTVFTPNEDGLNDYFALFSQDIPGEVQEFVVYDRWGNRVFQLDEKVTLPRDDASWGWDGKHQGTGVTAGVYVYYAVVETLGVTKELKGSVTLVR